MCRTRVAYNRHTALFGEKAVSMPTVRPGLEEHLIRLSRTAEELRSKLETFRETLQRARLDLPVGVIERLRQMSSTLVELQQEQAISSQPTADTMELALGSSIRPTTRSWAISSARTLVEPSASAIRGKVP